MGGSRLLGPGLQRCTMMAAQHRERNLMPQSCALRVGQNGKGYLVYVAAIKRKVCASLQCTLWRGRELA